MAEYNSLVARNNCFEYFETVPNDIRGLVYELAMEKVSEPEPRQTHPSPRSIQ